VFGLEVLAVHKARRFTNVERMTRARARALDPLEREMESAFRRAVASVSGSARVKDLAEAIRAASVLDLEDVLNWPELGQPVVDAVNRPATIEAMSAAGTAESRITLGRPLYSLDITTPTAIDWLRTSGRQVLDRMTNVRRAALEEFLKVAAQRGLSPLQAARDLRELRIVGLNARQVRATLSFRARLRAAGVVGDVATKRLRAYVARQLNYRAETIAIDMLTRAFAAGQRALWAQGLADGYLDRRAVQQWITLEDACEICVPLDGVTVPLGQLFPGGYAGPGDPHPRCRCMVVLWPFGLESRAAA
jgi:hypothetical protein